MTQFPALDRAFAELEDTRFPALDKAFDDIFAGFTPPTFEDFPDLLQQRRVATLRRPGEFERGVRQLPRGLAAGGLTGLEGVAGAPSTLGRAIKGVGRLAEQRAIRSRVVIDASTGLQEIIGRAETGQPIGRTEQFVADPTLQRIGAATRTIGEFVERNPLSRAGEFVAQAAREGREKHFPPPEDAKPFSWVWFAYHGPSAIGTMGVAVAAGGVIGSSAKVSAVVGGITAGAIEARVVESEYKSLLMEQDYTEQESTDLAAMGAVAFGAASGIVEVFPMMSVFSKAPGLRGRFIGALKTAVLEGSEESVQELLDATTRVMSGIDEDAIKNMTASQLTQSFVLGGIAGGAVSITVSGQQRQVTPEQAQRITSIEGTPSRNDLMGIVRGSDKLNAHQRVEIKESIQEQLDAQARIKEQAARQPTQAQEEDVQPQVRPQVQAQEEVAQPQKKEFVYQLTLRPVSTATVPKGFLRLEDDGSQFGAVVYDKPLTKEQKRDFSLKPLDPKDPENLQRAFETRQSEIDELSDFSERGFEWGGLLYTKDTRRGDDAWRATSFTEGGKPSGHIEFDSYVEARDHAAASERTVTKEPARAKAIPRPETQVRPEEGRADIRRQRQKREGAEPIGQEPEAQVTKAEFQAAVPQGEANPFETGQKELGGEKFREGIGPDLMEAGRVLSVGVRSKKLRGVMAGVFRFPPGQIELRDIRWVRTLAHEVGHAVDFRLHGNKFLSNIKKRFPTLQIKERAARDELKRASEFIRPLEEFSWGDGTSHMRYRAGADELMADLFSLYALRKEKARELAPNVTAALENELSNNPVVQEAVTTILSPEKIEPKTAVRRTEQKTTLPEKIKPGPTPADRVLRQEVIDLVRTTARTMEGQINRVQQVSRKWRKALSEKQREDIASFVEGIGNVNIKGDTIEAVKARMTPEMRKVAREFRFEQELNRQEVNKLFDEAGSGSEAVRFIADYIPHFYQVTPKRALAFAARWQKNTPHTRQRVFPTLKQAVEAGLKPTSLDIAFLYEKAADNNFKAALSRKFARRLKTMRATSGEPVMVNSLDKAGADWVKIDHPVLRHVYARPKKDGGVILGEGNAYVHPSIERPVKVLLGRHGTDGFMGAIHAINSAGKGINVAFSFFHEFTLFESSQAVNFRFLKPLRGIFIGPFEAKARGLGFLPKLTHRAGLMLGETDTYGAEDATKHGLNLRRTASTDYARGWMEKMLRAVEARAPRFGGAAGGALIGANIGGNIGAGIARTILPVPLSKTAGGVVGAVSGGTVGSAIGLVVGVKPMRQLFEAYQRHLWDNVHVGLKLFAYNSIVSDSINNLPKGVSAKQAKEAIASHINDAFGGQEFLESPVIKRGEKSLSEPMTVKQTQIAHALVFAPDWSWSNIRVAGRAVIANATKPKSIEASLGRQYWIGMVTSLTMMSTLAQMAIWTLLGSSDDDMEPFPWDNEIGHEWDVDVTPIKRAVQKTLGMDVQGHRSYVHAGKQAREVIRYFEEFPSGFFTNIGNKSSVSVRILFEQMTGHSIGSGWPAPWVDSGFNDGLEGWEQIWARGKATGENFVPFAWQENNFAFALPLRKGMTRYKAMRYHHDAIQEHIDHPRRRDAAIALMKEIDEAARINGIDEDSRKRSFNNARSKIRAEHYRKFFEAIEDQDWNKADSEAEVLLRLGSTAPTAKASAKRRGIQDIDAEIHLRLPVVNDELDYDRIIAQ